MHFFDFSLENICVFGIFVVILQAFSREVRENNIIN